MQFGNYIFRSMTTCHSLNLLSIQELTLAILQLLVRAPRFTVNLQKGYFQFTKVKF